MTAPFLHVPIFSWPAAPGGLLYCYAAGSTTPKDTYTDTAGTVTNTNPVVLDANGSATVRLGAGTYKFVLKDSTGATTLWSADEYADTYLTAAEVGALIWPITTAENAASVTPATLVAEPGNQYAGRYNAISDAISQQDNGGAPVIASSGGMRLKGSLGAGVRPEAQLILENTTTSGHAILTMVNNNHTDESAWEAVGLLDNGGYFQHGAQFWRFIGGDNGALTYKSVWAVHVTRYGADNCPLIVSSNNGVLVCGGDTTTTKWATEITANWFDVYTSLMSRTSIVVGSNHAYSTNTLNGFYFEVAGNAQFGDVDGSKNTNNAIQLGYSTPGTTAFIQAANNAATSIPLLITASAINFAVGDLKPTTNNALSLGSNALAWKNIYSVNAITVTSDQRLKDDAGDITDAEQDWARLIKRLFRKYTLKADDSKKLRFGVYAQEVVEAAAQAGITQPLAYNFIVYENDQYGIRYDELLSFVIAAL